MRDPHLQRVRRAFALNTRLGNRRAAKEMGVKAPEFKQLLDEYWKRRKARTLFVDIEDTTEADMYNHMSIMTAAARQNTEKASAENEG